MAKWNLQRLLTVIVSAASCHLNRLARYYRSGEDGARRQRKFRLDVTMPDIGGIFHIFIDDEVSLMKSADDEVKLFASRNALERLWREWAGRRADAPSERYARNKVAERSNRWLEKPKPLPLVIHLFRRVKPVALKLEDNEKSAGKSLQVCPDSAAENWLSSVRSDERSVVMK